MKRAPRDRGLAARIHRQLKRDAADLVDFAAAMMRIPTENPPGTSYAKCAALIASRLRQLGLTPRLIDPSGSGPSVVGTFGEGKRVLYFSGHYDVVPAQHRTQFTPVVRKASLHGRGSADMKGGIAAMAFAMHALERAGFEPAGRIVSVSVPDEETSGPRGTVALAAAGLIERDAVGMLTMEPTGGIVWNANRGVISLRIAVRGRPAHVGLHFRGVNVFRGMLDVAGGFAALEGEVAQRATAFTIRPDAARRSVLLLGGEFAGGHNFNKSTLAHALGSSIRGVTGRATRFELCPGVLETRHYAALGIPALAYGPGLLSVSHGPNECVSVRRLIECAEVYALAAVRLLS